MVDTPTTSASKRKAKKLKSVAFDEGRNVDSPPPGMTEYRGVFLEEKHPMPSDGLHSPSDEPRSLESVSSGEFAAHSKAAFKEEREAASRSKFRWRMSLKGGTSSAVDDTVQMKPIEEIDKEEDERIRANLMAEEKRQREEDEKRKEEEKKNREARLQHRRRGRRPQEDIRYKGTTRDLYE